MLSVKRVKNHCCYGETYVWEGYEVDDKHKLYGN